MRSVGVLERERGEERESVGVLECWSVEVLE
jgi:hypothetical protein